MTIICTLFAELGELRVGPSLTINPTTNISNIADNVIFSNSKKKMNGDYSLFGSLIIELWGTKFNFGGRFYKGNIHSLSFTRRDSTVEKLGYDATESDLLKEKAVLTRLFSKNINREPSAISLGVNYFAYDWGEIRIIANPRFASWAGIQMCYKERN